MASYLENLKALSVAKPVTDGDTAEFAAGDLALTLD